MVDEGFDAGDRAGADGREVGAFAEVTSELAVEVLDGAFLPSGVGGKSGRWFSRRGTRCRCRSGCG